MQVRNINLFYMLMIVGMLLIILGMRCQFDVYKANAGKMPVINNSLTQELSVKINLEDYILYNNKEEIKKYWLSDIIPFFNQGYFSIGDILIYLGIILCISNLVAHVADSYILKKCQVEDLGVKS